MSRARLAATPTYLYRLYDEDDRLVYVGITVDPDQRFDSHRHSRLHSWWPRVRTYSLELFPSRAEASFAEKAAIILETPTSNLAGRGFPNSMYASGGWWAGKLLDEQQRYGVSERDAVRYRKLRLLAMDKAEEADNLADDPDRADERQLAIDWVVKFAEQIEQISSLSGEDVVQLLGLELNG